MQEAQQRIINVGGRVLGAVINGASSSGQYGYGYGYGYGREYGRGNNYGEGGSKNGLSQGEKPV